jgi:hypothetical protein
MRDIAAARDVFFHVGSVVVWLPHTLTNGAGILDHEGAGDPRAVAAVRSPA